MNNQIARLFTVIVVLFGILVVFTSRWTVFEADSLESQEIDGTQVNQRPLLEQQRIPRGVIRAADGTRLATNTKTGSGQTRVYKRRYPQGSVFAHTIGYSFIEAGDSGLERYYNDELAGNKDEFGSLLDQVLGERKEGEDRGRRWTRRGRRPPFLRCRGGTGRWSRWSRRPARCW